MAPKAFVLVEKEVLGHDGLAGESKVLARTSVLIMRGESEACGFAPGRVGRGEGTGTYGDGTSATSAKTAAGDERASVV